MYEGINYSCHLCVFICSPIYHYHFEMRSCSDCGCVPRVQEEPFVKSATGAAVPHASSRFEGFCMDIIYALQESLGFQYKVYLKQDFGKRLKNGSWTGLMGELTNGVSTLKCFSSVNLQ